MDFQLLQTANVTFIDYEKDKLAVQNLKLDFKTFYKVQQLYQNLYGYVILIKKIYKKIYKANVMIGLEQSSPVFHVLPSWDDVQNQLRFYIEPKNRNLLLLSQIDMNIKQFDVYLWKSFIKANILEEGIMLCISIFIQSLYNITLLDNILKVFKFNNVKKFNFIYNNIFNLNTELCRYVEEKNPINFNIKILLTHLKNCKALQQHVYFNLIQKCKCCTKLKYKTIGSCKTPNNTFYKMYSLLLNKQLFL